MGPVVVPVTQEPGAIVAVLVLDRGIQDLLQVLERAVGGLLKWDDWQGVGPDALHVHKV